MKKSLRAAFTVVLAIGFFAGLIPRAGAADYAGYTALDPSQPVSFDGNKVTWNGKTFTLDENTLFLDYRLDKAKLAGNRYAFNNFNEAKAALKHGTATKPMLLLTAPGVYWVDDPDDPAIRGGAGGPPFGAVIACNHLYFYGLNSKWQNVVFAVNRGQTQGSNGNFTMFQIQGNGLKSENVTFGNYCNVDLKFPLNPALARPKRAEAIAQAQLFSYNGGDGVAINSAFVSRLNLLPFAQTYINCHVESSGHAGGNSVYINSELEFYGVNFTSGRAFLNCDIYLKPPVARNAGRTVHRFGIMDGSGSGRAAIDVRLHRSQEMIDNNVALEFSWDRVPQSPTTRSYQFNVTLDGKPYVIQETSTPGATVVLKEGSDLLKAFKVVHNGQTYYNVPNIFPGVDPFGYAPAIKAAAVAAGKDENYYLTIPTAATLQPPGAGGAPGGGRGGRGGRGGPGGAAAGGRGAADGAVAAPAEVAAAPAGAAGAPAPAGRGGFGGGGAGNITIRSGQTTAILAAGVTPASAASSAALGKWQFTSNQPDMVQLTPGANNSVTVAGSNKTADAVEVLIVAKNDLGLEACTRVTVEPGFVAPPAFAQAPAIAAPVDGRATLSYKLNLGSGTDESLITWYRCTDAQGANPLKVAVSRRDRPETSYVVSDGDVGSYLMATIQPKLNVSEPGPIQTVYSRTAIAKNDVTVRTIDTDFQNFPTDPQPKIIPATWTLDGYSPPEMNAGNAQRFAVSPNAWTYGKGQAGSLDYYGLYQSARGARLFYTPADGKYSDMTVRAKYAPNKNTGQGFGSATQQFLDTYIKYDLATRNGYGLRIQRITSEETDAIGYKGAGAVAGCAFFLVQYKDGVATPITKKIMSSAFNAECTVELTAKNGRLLASVTSTQKSRSGDAYDFPREVQFDAPIESNSYGGTGLHFTGTVGVNAVHVTGWRTSWGR